MLDKFSRWLAATPVSTIVQDVTWIIPTVQTIHILAIAIALSSTAMLDLRLLGWTGMRVTVSAMAERLLPWIWGALAILALTGAVLIVGEPGRSLPNPAFQIKMGLVLCAVALTLLFHQTLRRDTGFWDQSPRRRRSVRLFAVISLSIWLAIAVCGRLIAYVGQDL